MLKSFQIRNFRLFQHLEVANLGRVNLIVGKNNSGKSTFLEAVKLYASCASSEVLLSLIESRQETWVSPAQPFSSLTAHPVRHLFWAHKLPDLDAEGIYLGEISSDRNIHIRTAVYQTKEDEGIFRKVRVPNVQVDEDISNIEVFIVAEEGEKTRRVFKLDWELRDILHNSRLGFHDQEPSFKYLCQAISTENMPDSKVAALWDMTSLTSLEPEIILALGLIDQRILGIAFVEDISQGRGRDNRIPLVKIQGIEEPLPLKNMGDGMTRLLHIVLALVNARDGVLLIDEFENGLHWTIQPKVWDVVFQLAEKLNVQVFATTHSRDCVEGFDDAWNRYPALGAFFRLDDKGGVIKATEYGSETLTDAIEMNVEVR
jgi:energy-coupling factor transporter ATP-binding protein EcfA2